MATSKPVRVDFRNSTAKLKNKSRSLNKFIRRNIKPYNEFKEQLSNRSEPLRPALPSRVKDLISLVTYWYKEFVLRQDYEDNVPILYAIELATVKTWKKFDKPKTLNMAIAFMAVMEELQNYNCQYTGQYDNESFTTALNVKDVAKETMRKPMFENVTVTRNWCRAPNYRDFREIKPSEPSILNKFITDYLQPDEEFHRSMFDALGKLCEYLQTELSPNVNRLIKGGSMGKGTALKDKSDLDCVLILNEIEGVEDLKSKINRIKDQLIDILQAKDWSDWKIEVGRSTRFCVKFGMSKPNKIVHVDLLPTFAKEKIGYKKLYQEMEDKDEDTQRFYSAALTELQIEFVKHKPSKVKDLIRLVKHWCKEYVVENKKHADGVFPNSYLLEMVTIHAWEEAGSPNQFDMAVGFRAVMEKLRCHRQLDIVWYDNYDRGEVIFKCAPRIIDPANPRNNVYNIVTVWPRVVEVVNQTLKKPLMKELTVTRNWRRSGQ